MSTVKHELDMARPIAWAGEAVTGGTAANVALLSGLGRLVPNAAKAVLTNPRSSREDGINPALTSVVLCNAVTRDGVVRLCVKLYPECASGLRLMEYHAAVVSSLRGRVPVPEVLGVFPGAEEFGLPALVTTAVGRSLDDELAAVGSAVRLRIAADAARALATLHSCEPTTLPVRGRHDPKTILHQWESDAAWCQENAPRAEESAALVHEAAAVLAQCGDVPERACAVHRDPKPHNMLAADGRFAAIVDWDKAAVSVAEEDVGKMVVGLLGTLSMPRRARLPVARGFLAAYAEAVRIPVERLYARILPFALDVALDWVIGVKNAPRQDMAWATEQILRRTCM